MTDIQRKYEVKFYRRIRTILDAEVEKVVSVLKSEGIIAAQSYVSKILSIEELPKIVEQMYVEIGGRFARKTWIDLNNQRRAKGFGFNAKWVEWIKDFLYRYLIDKITFEVAQTTKSILLQTLQQAFQEGWGINETVKNLRDLPFKKYQAARIARTEGTRAANAGIYAAGQTFPFQQTKEWIAAHDKRTRGQEKKPHASHVLLDRQVIDFEDYFVDPINGDKLLFPGDPQGSAASVINCRCVIALMAKRDENGKLIPKVNEWQLQLR